MTAGFVQTNPMKTGQKTAAWGIVDRPLRGPGVGRQRHPEPGGGLPGGEASLRFPLFSRFAIAQYGGWT